MKVGDKVTWENQSQGCMTKKTGDIIAEIPAGTSAMQYVRKTEKKSHVKFKDISAIDRVLIAVPAGKDGAIMHYYCPAKAVLVMQGN